MASCNERGVICSIFVEFCGTLWCFAEFCGKEWQVCDIFWESMAFCSKVWLTRLGDIFLASCDLLQGVASHTQSDFVAKCGMFVAFSI